MKQQIETLAIPVLKWFAAGGVLGAALLAESLTTVDGGLLGPAIILICVSGTGLLAAGFAVVMVVL